MEGHKVLTTKSHEHVLFSKTHHMISQDTSLPDNTHTARFHILGSKVGHRRWLRQAQRQVLFRSQIVASESQPQDAAHPPFSAVALATREPKVFWRGPQFWACSVSASRASHLLLLRVRSQAAKAFGFLGPMRSVDLGLVLSARHDAAIEAVTGPLCQYAATQVPLQARTSHQGMANTALWHLRRSYSRSLIGHTGHDTHSALSLQLGFGTASGCEAIRRRRGPLPPDHGPRPRVQPDRHFLRPA